MKLTRTELPEVLLLEPKVFEDPRGYTYESYNRRSLREAADIDVEFVQDNRSRSVKNTIRGLHYQMGSPQSKLVSVLSGRIFDVAVDLRRSSPNFGKWTAFELSGENRRLAWIPPGFGHAFLALSDSAEVFYKMSEYWAPSLERIIRWDDADLAIRWPLEGKPVLSKRDAEAVKFRDAEVFA
jgi:dTDP-4-dehydrorhamnose 3,5-epimerase